MMDAFDWYQEITREVRKSGRVVKLRRPKMETTGPDDRDDLIKYWFISTVAIQAHYHGPDEVFVAIADGQVRGYAALRDRPVDKNKDTAELMRMFVSFDCRRMGLGKRLFLLCAEAARAAGMRRMVIRTEESVESNAFYKAMGCVPVRADKALRREIRAKKSDILMEYSLNILPEKENRHEAFPA